MASVIRADYLAIIPTEIFPAVATFPMTAMIATFPATAMIATVPTMAVIATVFPVTSSAVVSFVVSTVVLCGRGDNANRQCGSGYEQNTCDQVSHGISSTPTLMQNGFLRPGSLRGK